jgi:hypothetical protein
MRSFIVQCSSDQSPPRDQRVPADVEYIKMLMEIAGEDVRQVYIRVTAATGLAALFVTQLPFDELVALPRFSRWLLVVAVLVGAAAARLYFYYLSQMHWCRLKMAAFLRQGDAAMAAQLWAGEGTFWDKYKWLFRVANLCFGASVLLFAIVLGVMLGLF